MSNTVVPNKLSCYLKVPMLVSCNYHEKFSYDKAILLFTASHIELISFEKIFFLVIYWIYLHENMKRMHHIILKGILGIYQVVSLILCRGCYKMRQLLCQLNQPWLCWLLFLLFLHCLRLWICKDCSWLTVQGQPWYYVTICLKLYVLYVMPLSVRMIYILDPS